MRPSELQRKCALIRFLCLKNQTGEEGDILELPKNRNHKMPLLNVVRKTFENWLRASNEQLDNSSKKADAALRVYIQSIGNTPPDDGRRLLDDDFGVMELGKFLGLTRAECREAIDLALGELAPTYTIFSMSADDSRTLFDTYKGVYVVYRAERTERAQQEFDRPLSIMTLAMSVRHQLPGHKVTSTKLRRIRCKLHAYSYTSPQPNADREKKPIVEYDGYVTPEDRVGLHHWFFQARKDRENDTMYLITDGIETRRSGEDGERRPRHFMLGTLFSRSQDRNLRSVAWPVVAERIEATDHLLGTEGNRPDDWREFDDEESYLMRALTDMHDPAEVDPVILDMLDEAHGFTTFMPVNLPGGGERVEKG